MTLTGAVIHQTKDRRTGVVEGKR